MSLVALREKLNKADHNNYLSILRMGRVGFLESENGPFVNFWLGRVELILFFCKKPL